MGYVNNKDKFLKRVSISPNGCWIWQTADKVSGYGRFRLNGKAQQAHRVSYEYFIGNLSECDHLHHKCGNSLCVNPDHLLLVSVEAHARFTAASRTNNPKQRITALDQQNIISGSSLSDNNCWIWKGRPDKNGYGRITFQETYHKAHRVAYLVFKGAIPKGLHVHHICNNKVCVNPAHLEVIAPGEHTRLTASGRTRCKHGHLFSPETTTILSNGHRRCEICHRRRQRDNIQQIADKRKLQPKKSRTKTHCCRGHELTGDNIHVRANGQRICKICDCLRSMKYYWKKRGDYSKISELGL